jgi:hypothetical protein
MTLQSLLSLPPRELDARLAHCLGWRWVAVVPMAIEHAMDINADERYNRHAILLPPDQVSRCNQKHIWDSHPGFMAARDGAKDVPAYSSPSAPRSLLDGVEAELKKRGLCDEYVAALADAYRQDWCGAHCDECRHWALTHAPAPIRAACAAWVLEGAGPEQMGLEG